MTKISTFEKQINWEIIKLLFYTPKKIYYEFKHLFEKFKKNFSVTSSS